MTGTSDPPSDPPEDAVEEAERLTRLARRAADADEAATYRERRDDLLAEYGYETRLREDDGDAVLVCYPAEWLDEEGTVRLDRVEDTDRAVEVALTGPGAAEEWDAVEAHNRDLVDAVREEHGSVHAANAAAFADFMGNHRARRIETATAADVEEFLTEYFVRNAWPTDEQRAVVERSLERLFETAGEDLPR